MRVVALRRSETPRVSRGRKQTEGVKHEEAKADGRGQARDRIDAQVRPHRVRDREGAHPSPSAPTPADRITLPAWPPSSRASPSRADLTDSRSSPSRTAASPPMPPASEASSWHGRHRCSKPTSSQCPPNDGPSCFRTPNFCSAAVILMMPRCVMPTSDAIDSVVANLFNPTIR